MTSFKSRLLALQCPLVDHSETEAAVEELIRVGDLKHRQDLIQWILDKIISVDAPPVGNLSTIAGEQAAKEVERDGQGRRLRILERKLAALAVPEAENFLRGEDHGKEGGNATTWDYLMSLAERGGVKNAAAEFFTSQLDTLCFDQNRKQPPSLIPRDFEKEARLCCKKVPSEEKFYQVLDLFKDNVEDLKASEEGGRDDEDVAGDLSSLTSHCGDFLESYVRRYERWLEEGKVTDTELPTIPTETAKKALESFSARAAVLTMLKEDVLSIRKMGEELHNNQK